MQTLTTEALKQWMEEGHAFTLVDVREPFERSAFHIGGLHIPLGDLALRWREIPVGGPVVFYCAKGIRSGIAVQRLEGAGLGDLYNLAGGLAGWRGRVNNE